MSRLAFLALLAIAACGDSTGPAPVPETYRLETIDGHALPYVTSHNEAAQYTAERISESYSLYSDKTFSFTYKTRVTVTGVWDDVSATYEGTWSAAGNKVTFVFTNEQFVRVGTLSGDTLTIVDAGTGAVMIYKKS